MLLGIRLLGATFQGGLSNRQADTAQMHLVEKHIAGCRPLLGALPLSLTTSSTTSSTTDSDTDNATDSTTDSTTDSSTDSTDFPFLAADSKADSAAALPSCRGRGHVVARGN